jgi:hypothetical protein
MMEKMQGKMGEWSKWANEHPEEFQKKMQWCGEKFKNWDGDCKGWGNFNGKHGWKEARAVCLRKPEQVLQIAPGMTHIIELEV